MLLCDDDDDVVVIALWIISIGFVILAIDKTTKLSNGIDCKKRKMKQPECQPSFQQQHSPQHSQDDQQFQEILQQLSQLKNGISALKKDVVNNHAKTNFSPNITNKNELTITNNNKSMITNKNVSKNSKNKKRRPKM